MILWTARPGGSDNVPGDIAFIAPMKTKPFKALVLKNKQGGGFALLFICLLAFAITPVSAQFPAQKRITGLQLGEAAEGSRVTIVSDSTLSDYEAFRRGNWFYVKIPLAEFRSFPPRCCGNGFENVQVQRVGDSLIVSFKLQPGASARVDQRSNRLDVIFSSPNRGLRSSGPNTASTRVNGGSNFSPTSQYRGPDAAGPVPFASARAFSRRAVTERTRETIEIRGPQNPSIQASSQADSKRGANKQAISGNIQSSGSKPAIASSSPGVSAAPIVRPSTSTNYPTSTTAPPAVSVGSQPPVSAPTSFGSLNWRARGKAALQWLSGNRLATLLGALILLSLVLYLATLVRRRREKLVEARRVTASAKVQPKYSSGADLEELPGAGLAAPSPSSTVPQEAAKKLASASAVAGAASHNHGWGLTKPSITSSSAGHQQSTDEEEREVIEL